jgi:predicted RNA-binding protein with PIN domain
MNLLVDGHNLIGQIPSLSLSDRDDEARLVIMLRRYSVRSRKHQVIVVFDRGVYGHPQKLDGYGISCHFALSPQDADTQLIRRIRELARPKEWALVSSDRAIKAVAQERGVRVIDARQFAQELIEAPSKANSSKSSNSSTPSSSPEKRDVRLSEAELREWMRLFGEDPDAPS